MATVRVQCPHCASLCQVDERHLGAPVQCGKCRRAFAVRPTPAKGPPPAPESEESVHLVLDGPAAAALAPPKPGPAVTEPPPCLASGLDVAGATSSGRVRPRNEDSFLVQHLAWSNLDRRHEVALAVVADGVGGNDAGDQASGLVVRTIAASLAGPIAGALGGQLPQAPPERLAEAVGHALQEANRAVHRHGQTQPGCRGMAATAALALVWDDVAVVGHVGDCRAYHYRGDELRQVTRDQTLVARMVELGQLSPREALTHPSRHEVTQALGRSGDLTPGTCQLRLTAGDWLLVTCDGLHAHLDERALEDAVRVAAPSARYLAARLVDLADRAGGSDNCTVVAVRCC